MRTILKLALKIASLAPSRAAIICCNILLEDGVSNLLKEDGSFLLQE